jgi:hypothetical protein
MPIVRFPWDAQLVSLRREVCLHAKWDKARHAWTMTAAEAAVFLQAAQARLYAARVTGTVTVDDTVWVLGFAQAHPAACGGIRCGRAPSRRAAPGDTAGRSPVSPGRRRHPALLLQVREGKLGAVSLGSARHQRMR